MGVSSDEKLDKIPNDPSGLQVEKVDSTTPQLKLDKHGLPLVPQPTDNKDDPYNWPLWLRVYIAIMISGLGFISQVGNSLINPAYVQMSKDLHVSLVKCTYTTTTAVLFAGVSPMFIVPYSNLYGRRYIYLSFTLLAILSQVGSGAATTYGGLMTARVFYGIGSGIPLGIGAATICDLFTQGERGLYMGIYTLCVNNGPHIAPIMGGYIAQNLSWKWCYYIPGILAAGLWFILIFTLPETLYSRTSPASISTSFASKLFPRGKLMPHTIKPYSFVHPYFTIRYLAVLLPAIYWGTANTYGSILFAVTGSHLAKVLYDFDLGQTGLLMGIPLTVGCSIGESTAGWVSDFIINAYAKRHNGYRKPEIRLALIPGCFALVAGTIAYGPCVQDHKPWWTLAICMGVAGFGVQVGATMVYTYTTDCYKPQSAEIGAVLNLFKSLLAFTVSFYALPFGESSGYNVSFPILGMINGIALLPLIGLFFYGEKLRKLQGKSTGEGIGSGVPGEEKDE